jgi:hypothetical protein
MSLRSPMFGFTGCWDDAREAQLAERFAVLT